MDEELKDLATTGLTKALEYIETAESFVVEQAPLLVQEILSYGLVSTSMSALILFVLASGFGYGMYRGAKVAFNDDADEAGFVLALVGACVSIGCTIGMFKELFVVAKIVFAPRLYLLQELKSLL